MLESVAWLSHVGSGVRVNVQTNLEVCHTGSWRMGRCVRGKASKLKRKVCFQPTPLVVPAREEDDYGILISFKREGKRSVMPRTYPI